jgi:hypothetical protein
MTFWDFMHNTIGVHAYFFPTLILAVAIPTVALVHGHKQKKRDDEFEEELEKKLDQPFGAGPADRQ